MYSQQYYTYQECVTYYRRKSCSAEAPIVKLTTGSKNGPSCHMGTIQAPYLPGTLISCRVRQDASLRTIVNMGKKEKEASRVVVGIGTNRVPCGHAISNFPALLRAVHRKG